MKEIQNKLDSIFIKAGHFNRYQFIIVTLFLLQFICSQFFHNNFSYLTSRPLIIINNTELRIDSYICDKYFSDIDSRNEIILREKQVPTTSIILDYKIYCENIKTYLINIFYYVGIILGSLISYNFYDKVGTKLTLSIFIPTQIICFILFQLLNLNNLKNNIYILYANLFLLGMSEYIIINILFLYMCDIIHLSNIPMFMTIIISGRPISFLIGIFFFNFCHLNWKTDLAILATADIIIFLLILKYMTNSPKAALRNNKYFNFMRNLYEISKKNKKYLTKEDFDFLSPFMNDNEKEQYENIFLTESNNILKNINNEDNNSINDNEIYFHKEKAINNVILNSPLLVNSDKLDENVIEDNYLILKEEYLLSDDNNKIGSIKTLFNKTKMNDYSPLDFFKFKSLLINFCILSFLWSVYNFIKYGLDSIAKKIPEYNDNIIWVLGTHIIGIISLYFILLMYISNIRAFHKILVSIQLITFISLLFALHLDNVSVNKNIYIFSIVVAQVSWNFLYLLLIIITLLIYPIMLRSKGLGWNIAFGTIGKLVVMFLVDLSNEHEYLLYFMLFDFLLLVFSYGLPKRIGSFVLGFTNYDENRKKDIFEEDEEDEEIINLVKT